MKPNRDGLAAHAVASNGLLHRRALLGRGLALAGAMGAGVGVSTGAAAEPLTEPDWSLVPGGSMPPYQVPSRFENNVVRLIDNPNNLPQISHARTPHQLLSGVITPNGLHFNVNHGSVPDIDPAKHKLLIHGLVKRPLVFAVDALLRYPMVSRINFLECGGNSASLFSNDPAQATVQQIHGFASCSDWTGVPLSVLLDEAGVDPKARWFIAEGADAPHLTRSLPLGKAFDDAIVALYQNGERLMPGNGYPMRLFLPGWEGNMNTKYLRRIKLTDGPTLSYHEAHTYTDPLPNGQSFQFYFVQEVKSFITSPSPGVGPKAPGYVELTGVAYSGNGRITKVMVSADGGNSWGEAALQGTPLPKAFTRFRMPWQWNGGPAVLQSRAWDEAGNVQPTRAEFIALRGETKSPASWQSFPSHHFNAVASWAVDPKGEVTNVYA
ncbi:MAG TPA: sulfite dehydrogenase [Xanthobacteraceae bacterium]|jgi:sulfane dehydrogenase subunit SoxC|nr:sulfite dehydrogenase [Xanthobacteraceae bacterium]